MDSMTWHKDGSCSPSPRLHLLSNNGKHNVEIEELENQNMSNVASSAVRKGLNDDLPVEANGPSLNGNDNLGKLPLSRSSKWQQIGQDLCQDSRRSNYADQE